MERGRRSSGKNNYGKIAFLNFLILFQDIFLKFDSILIKH